MIEYMLEKLLKIYLRRDIMFDLVSKYKPSGDQPKAIEELVNGLNENKKYQVLLGATGTGKTFTIANVIKEVNKPTLVLAHNKTLAGQLLCLLFIFYLEICTRRIPQAFLHLCFCQEGLQLQKQKGRL